MKSLRTLGCPDWRRSGGFTASASRSVLHDLLGLRRSKRRVAPHLVSQGMCRMSVPSPPWAAAIYPAAQLFIDRSLRSGASFVTGEPYVWTADAAEDFYERFVVKEDLGAASFLEKLSGQLSGAERSTIL